MRTKTDFGISRERGFTLIELIVTLAVAAIILSVGVPSFRGVIMDNRLVSQANQFVTSVKMARSAAVRYQRPATVCSTANFDAAVPTCSANNDWSDGWFVWVDKNRDTLTDANEVIAVFGPINDASTLSSGTVSSFTYDARGFATTSGGDLTLCDNRTAEMGRLIKVNSVGRTNVKRAGCS
ncbi:MAG: GspH/FimT family pseudopilin [Gammaproteobacteria bacterium]|nr:GspH/FimT family pseudopilin [Gammaproteobacteria bacterium]MBT8109640.1 GspH/FimT family pseudopilin [Gammaproteobacteria bacterium]NND46519.1 prepilin-type N-terminal cleavage/methylation domain-containing protein [Woeseiaceae bacterium]NNL44344.1 prepilin-type N-terminal cleavage/methylation domain-containing protein [Woeseiaceae bacterium]